MLGQAPKGFSAATKCFCTEHEVRVACGVDVVRRRAADVPDIHNIFVTDDDGQPIMGQWEPIIDVETWQAVQVKLDDHSRVTNNGSTPFAFPPSSSRARDIVSNAVGQMSGHEV